MCLYVCVILRQLKDKSLVLPLSPRRFRDPWLRVCVVLVGVAVSVCVCVCVCVLIYVCKKSRRGKLKYAGGREEGKRKRGPQRHIKNRVIAKLKEGLPMILPVSVCVWKCQ